LGPAAVRGGRYRHPPDRIRSERDVHATEHPEEHYLWR